MATTRKKVYGNTTDLSNARTTMGDGYDYVDTSVQGYQAPNDYNDSIVVGGTGAIGGVANSGSGVRLAGANRAETLSAMQKYINAQKQQTIPTFNSQEYIDGITNSGNVAIDEAQKARDAIIQARLDEQTSLQGEQERTVEDNLTKNTETIQGNTYEAQEAQRASGVQRGIVYSQQQQGLEQGISRAGTKMIVDAGKERDTAILNIRDRISALKNSASLEKQSSLNQASSEKAKLLSDTTNMANQRQWGIDDMQANQNFETQKMEQEFNNQLEAMAVDQGYKKELQQLDTAEKLKVMKVQNDYEVQGKQIDLASAIKLAGINNSADMARTQAQINASAKENQARINADKANAIAKAGAEKNEFLNNFLAKDPTFNPYNLKDTKSQAQLEQLAKLNGVSTETLRILITGSSAESNKAIATVAKSKGVSTSVITNNIKTSFDRARTASGVLDKVGSSISSYLNSANRYNAKK